MRYLVLAVALSAAGCGITGPGDDLSGHWVAQPAGHFSLIGLTLAQSGDDITGTACAIVNGKVAYSGVPVTGEYPVLQFTVGAEVRFTGKQDGSRTSSAGTTRWTCDSNERQPASAGEFDASIRIPSRALDGWL